MSLICKQFTQNAWKKDLCSNCFKSEVEHCVSEKFKGPVDDIHNNGTWAGEPNGGSALTVNFPVHENIKSSIVDCHPHLNGAKFVNRTIINGTRPLNKELPTVNGSTINEISTVNGLKKTQPALATTTGRTQALKSLNGSTKTVNSCNGNGVNDNQSTIAAFTVSKNANTKIPLLNCTTGNDTVRLAPPLSRSTKITVDGPVVNGKNNTISSFNGSANGDSLEEKLPRITTTPSINGVVEKNLHMNGNYSNNTKDISHESNINKFQINGVKTSFTSNSVARQTTNGFNKQLINGTITQKSLAVSGVNGASSNGKSKGDIKQANIKNVYEMKNSEALRDNDMKNEKEDIKKESCEPNAIVPIKNHNNSTPRNKEAVSVDNELNGKQQTINGAATTDLTVPVWRLKLESNNKVSAVNKLNKKLSPRDRATAPVVGILKSSTVIKYRPTNRNLGFKEGDPLVISYADLDESDSEGEISRNDSYDDSDEDEDYDSLCDGEDEEELLRITRENTKYNANLSNFAQIEDRKREAREAIEAVTNGKVSYAKSMLQAHKNENCLIHNGDNKNDGHSLFEEVSLNDDCAKVELKNQNGIIEISVDNGETNITMVSNEPDICNEQGRCSESRLSGGERENEDHAWPQIHHLQEAELLNDCQQENEQASEPPNIPAPIYNHDLPNPEEMRPQRPPRRRAPSLPFDNPPTRKPPELPLISSSNKPPLPPPRVKSHNRAAPPKPRCPPPRPPPRAIDSNYQVNKMPNYAPNPITRQNSKTSTSYL